MFTSTLQKHHHFWLLETRSAADCASPWQHATVRETYYARRRAVAATAHAGAGGAARASTEAGGHEADLALELRRGKQVA